MFDDLFESAAASNSDSDDVVHPAAAAAAAAAAPPGNRDGEHHTAGSVLKLQLAQAKSQVARLKARQSKTESVTSCSFSQHVCKTVFGHAGHDTEKLLLLRDGSTMSVPLEAAGNRSATYQSHRMYALVSAVAAQAAGLAAMLKSQAQNITSIISSSCFDDAAMWMKDPATKSERDQGLRCEGTTVGPETSYGNAVEKSICQLITCQNRFSSHKPFRVTITMPSMIML